MLRNQDEFLINDQNKDEYLIKKMIDQIKELAEDRWRYGKKREKFIKEFSKVDLIPTDKAACLMTENSNGHLLGITIARQDGAAQVIEYLKLLNQLAVQVPAKIVDLLLLKDADGKTFQEYLRNQDAICAYVKFRTELLNKGGDAVQLQQLWTLDDVFCANFTYYSTWNWETSKNYVDFLIALTKHNIKATEITPKSRIAWQIHSYFSDLREAKPIFDIINSGLSGICIEPSREGHTNYFQYKATEIYHYILGLAPDEKIKALKNGLNVEHPLGVYFNGNLLDTLKKQMRSEYDKIQLQERSSSSAGIMLQLKNLSTKEKWMVTLDQVKKGFDPDALAAQLNQINLSGSPTDQQSVITSAPSQAVSSSPVAHLKFNQASPQPDENQNQFSPRTGMRK